MRQEKIKQEQKNEACANKPDINITKHTGTAPMHKERAAAAAAAAAAEKEVTREEEMQIYREHSGKHKETRLNTALLMKMALASI